MDQKLAMKLYEVMCKTEALEKNLTVGKNTKGEYKAIGEASVLNMIKPLFKEYKLILLPRTGEISEHVDRTIAYNKEGTRAVTQLKVYFDIIDVETGESTTIMGVGNGADSQDKGSGKAFTYALKTALQKSFMLFSGEDTDNTHSDEISQQSHGDQPVKVTTQQLIDIAEECGYDSDYLINKYNKEHNKKITDVKYIKAEIKTQYFNTLTALYESHKGK